MSKKTKIPKTNKAGKKVSTIDAGGGILVDIVETKPAREAKPAKETKAKGSKTKKTPVEKKPKKVSGLDAAFEVLKAKGEPMPAKAIAEAVIAAGWKTSGKTPAATLYSAMLREIDNKPGESRFKKVDRGLFTAITPKA